MNAQQRQKAGRQYIVYHLKMTEVLHLMLLSYQLSEKNEAPENVLGHSAAYFKETLLSVVVSSFMAVCDREKGTDIREIWKQLHPRVAKAIDRLWDKNISPGELVMRKYRDSAGAHGDTLFRYFTAKVELQSNKEPVLQALNCFLWLSIHLLRRQEKDLPEFASELEAILLDLELKFSDGGFNRRWLKRMGLIQGGRYTKLFR